MTSGLLIGLGAGAASALLYAAPLGGAPLVLAFLLFYVAPLPNFVVGLGWGALPAVTAGLSGTALTFLVLGAAAGWVYLLFLAVPVNVLCQLALLSRRTTPEGATEAQVEWYPPERLIASAAIMAGMLGAAVAVGVGYDPETFRAAVETMFRDGPLKELAQAQGLDDQRVRDLSGLVARTLPAAAAAIWLLTTLGNLWGASRIVEASGRSSRPPIHLLSADLPPLFPVLLGIVLGLSFVPGMPGLIASAFAAAIILAYVFVGLGIIHAWARGRPNKQVLLIGLYMFILLFGWVALVIAILGVADPVFHLRQRAERSAAKFSKPNDQS